MFTVGLIDQITSPAHKATQSFDGLITTAKSGFRDMAAGAVGLAGTGAMIYQGLAPAIEMERALGELESAGMEQSTISELGDTALTLSASYGRAATEIVASSARIGRSIQGLSDTEYAAFTEATTVLATSTKAGMDETANYVTQMYHRYQDTADAMGRAEWVQQLTGQTAYLKSQLGADTTEMINAMEGLNNLGSGLGVSMEEQMAVLATLGQSTGIAEAEQQYTNFLEYAVSAQDKLGMSFTDSNGNLLPMVTILQMLEDEFGNLESAETWAVLDDAFGDGSKLIQQLSKDTEGLNTTISEMGNIQGMDNAVGMAESMVDPWQQLAASLNAVRTAIGMALLPVITPLIEGMADGSQEVLQWTEMFPNLTKVIGLTVVTILALGAGMAMITLAAGLGSAAWAGFLTVMKLGRVITMAITAAQWAMNAAFLASPVGLIVIGITALVAILYAAWMGITALWNVFSETAAGEAFTAMIESIVAWFSSLGGIIDWVIDKINVIPGISIGEEGADNTVPAETAAYIPAAATATPAPEIDASGLQIEPPFQQESLANTGQVETGTASYIPETTAEITQPVIDTNSLNIEVPYRQESMGNEIPSGGITNQISRSINDNSNKTTNVAITTSQNMTPALLNEMLLMEGA